MPVQATRHDLELVGKVFMCLGAWMISAADGANRQSVLETIDQVSAEAHEDWQRRRVNHRERRSQARGKASSKGYRGGGRGGVRGRGSTIDAECVESEEEGGSARIQRRTATRTPHAPSPESV